MSAPAAIPPSLTGPRWACERCGGPCAATPGYQAGCAHYRVKSVAWQAKRRELLAPAVVPVPATSTTGQQGLAL